MTEFTAKDYNLTKPAYRLCDLVDDRIIGKRSAVLSEIKKGRLTSVKRGSSVLILTPDLVAYLNMLRKESHPND